MARLPTLPSDHTVLKVAPTLPPLIVAVAVPSHIPQVLLVVILFIRIAGASLTVKVSETAQPT